MNAFPGVSFFFGTFGLGGGASVVFLRDQQAGCCCVTTRKKGFNVFLCEMWARYNRSGNSVNGSLDLSLHLP